MGTLQNLLPLMILKNSITRRIRMYGTYGLPFTINKNPSFVSIYKPYMDPMGILIIAIVFCMFFSKNIQKSYRTLSPTIHIFQRSNMMGTFQFLAHLSRSAAPLGTVVTSPIHGIVARLGRIDLVRST